jgi:hypothetical protein
VTSGATGCFGVPCGPVRIILDAVATAAQLAPLIEVTLANDHRTTPFPELAVAGLD